MKVYTPNDLRRTLNARIKASGLSRYAYAKKIGAYPTQVSNFLIGQRETAGSAIMAHLGMQLAEHLFIRVPRKRKKSAKKKNGASK